MIFWAAFRWIWREKFDKLFFIQGSPFPPLVFEPFVLVFSGRGVFLRCLLQGTSATNRKFLHNNNFWLDVSDLVESFPLLAKRQISLLWLAETESHWTQRKCPGSELQNPAEMSGHDCTLLQWLYTCPQNRDVCLFVCFQTRSPMDITVKPELPGSKAPQQNEPSERTCLHLEETDHSKIKSCLKL